MAIPGDDRLRCRSCEGFLCAPTKVNPADYGLIENKHGAVTRKCLNPKCEQHWIVYAQELPKGSFKIILKMIDKLE